MSDKHLWELYSMEPSTEHFLETGDMEDISFYTEAFLSPLEDSLDCKMFRDYVILHIWYASLRFLQSCGMDPSHFHEVVAPCSPRKVGSGRDAMKEYVEGILRATLIYRDRERDAGGRKGLNKALQYIESHYMLEELSLNMVAEAMNFSPNYFSALFSQEMKTTFIEYVAARRMEQARILLRETNLRSIEIAPKIGYHDPHYFSYVFKRYNGCTPKEYRHRCKEE